MIDTKPFQKALDELLEQTGSLDPYKAHYSPESDWNRMITSMEALEKAFKTVRERIEEYKVDLHALDTKKPSR